MRPRGLVVFVTLTLLVYGLSSSADVTAERRAMDQVGHVCSPSISKVVPGQLNYQGFLANAADSSAVTATLEMTFRLFDSETKGAELWSETHSMVVISNGLFQVLLGSITPFPGDLFEGSPRWLQTEVGAEVLVPRKALASVGYSQRSGDADHAVMADWAADAEHAVHADTAAYSPSASVWTVSGDDVYRETGKVGIGTTSPLTELDVNGSVNAATYYGDGSNLTGISGTADDDWTIRGDTVFHQTGPVGIGTSDPEMLLDVYGGTARLTWGLIVGQTGTGVSGIHIYDHDTGPRLRFTNDTGMDSRCAISFVDTSGFLWTIDNDIYANGGQNFGIKDDRALEYRVFIDSAGQVGIGTISPSRTLDVSGEVNATTYYGDGSNLTGISGTTDNDWTISGNDIYSSLSGNVGIGTNTPQRQLHIKGSNPRILIEASSSSPEVNFMNTGDAGTDIWAVYKHGTTDDLRFYQGGDRVTFQDSTGNMGIGTAAPAEKLHVIGNLRASGTIQSGSSITIDGANDQVTSSGDLELHVNSGRALLIESDADSPNLIGGYSGNSVSGGIYGATIGGGGNSGGYNSVTGNYGTVAGGHNNAAGIGSFVGGGQNHTANGNGCIAGGVGNSAASIAFVGGGSGNAADCYAGTIAGGGINRATDEYTTIGGGWDNLAGNDVLPTTDAYFATIGGGRSNEASNAFTFVGGGDGNTADGEYATVPGGRDNTAQGKYSFAAGRRAKANHHGSFVWADTTDADFSSGWDNEFRIRAAHGLAVLSDNFAYGAYITNENGGGDGIRVYADVSLGHNWAALYARNYGTSPAIYATADTAGYFDGHVKVTGNIVKGGGGFQIDHPLDPGNRYLYHSSVESPDMKNVYDGVAVLDSRGQAWVELPDWFGALNRDFRYQLTAIGAPGPNLYIAEEISNNRFKIAGGLSGMKVSWQVTGIRQDAFANAHRIPVEEDKSGEERGKYLHAKAHGLPERMEIGYEARLKKENEFTLRNKGN